MRASCFGERAKCSWNMNDIIENMPLELLVQNDKIYSQIACLGGQRNRVNSKDSSAIG